MSYDLMVPARLRENARNLQKLFKGLRRGTRQTHYDIGGLGACNGPHTWRRALLTMDWWQVTCLSCISTHRRIQCKT